MTNEEFKKELEERTLRFAVDVMSFLKKLPNESIYWVLVTQLSKAATSIGANYREANRAESKNDFIHKIGIVEKESSESEYWLLILFHLEFISDVFKSDIESLHKEAIELTKLFSTINRKSKINRNN